MPDIGMFKKGLTMIGEDHHDGVLKQAFLIERLNQYAKLIIGLANFSIVKNRVIGASWPSAELGHNRW